MKHLKRLTVLTCAAIIAGAACSKKSDSSSSPAPAPAPTPAPVTMSKKEISATLTKNADGSSAIDLVLPDIAGVNTSHLGIADLNRETELRSADGKSIAALRAFENFATLVSVQYQTERSDGKLYILTLNAKAGNPNAYEAILTNIPLERNNALVRVESALDETSVVCNVKLSKSQSLATLADFYRKNPTATLEQYIDAKRTEAKSSDLKTCTAYDFTIGADGKIAITASPRSNDSENSGRNPTRPRSHRHEDGDDQRPRHRHNEPNGQQSQFPSPWPNDSQYSPPSQQQSPPSQQYTPPSQQQTPPSQQYSPPSQQQAPPSQYAPPVHQHVPPAQQQQVPPTQQQQQTVPQGYHTNWEACYASGYWRTDGNPYCKQKWWTNCSPEEGGKVCKIKAKISQQNQQKGPNSQYQENQQTPPSQYSPPTQQQQQVPPSQYSPPASQYSPPTQQDQSGQISQQQQQPVKAEWTTDFNVCYAAGKWKTDGNRYCKKDFWPNCSPDTGGNKCKPDYD